MARVRTTLDIDRRLLMNLVEESATAVIDQVAATTARRVRANIQSAGRIDTGTMIRSVNVTRPDTMERNITVDTPYAMYQEHGVRGPVLPVRAKVLRFKPKGASGFIFRPRTSGFPGAHFMRDAYLSLNQSDVHR